MVSLHVLQTRTRGPSPWDTRAVVVGLLHLEQISFTFDAEMGLSFSTMPPCLSCWLGRVCRLIIFSFSMRTLFAAGYTAITLPRFPFSLPEVTTTVSFFFISIVPVLLFISDFNF